MPEQDSENVEGPRSAPDLLGHDASMASIVSAMKSGRMPHAWLFTGPKGIGKASLAYRMAYFILCGGMAASNDDLFGNATSTALKLDKDTAVIRRAISGGHADFMVLERQWDEKAKRRKSEIVIDDVRKLQHFFAMTPAEGGWRVALVDSADEMNLNAANALLKILEEPPSRSVLILVSHAPGGLLPTIISRCRRLSMRPLPDASVNNLLAAWNPELSEERRNLLTWLVDGSPGRAEQLLAGEAIDCFDDCLTLLETLPNLNMATLHRLADKLNRRGKEEASEIALDALLSCVQRAIRAAAAEDSHAGGPIQLDVSATAAPGSQALEQWIEVWENMRNLKARSQALNLDRKQMVIQMFQWIAECSTKAA